jgi:hypothetical protein
MGTMSVVRRAALVALAVAVGVVIPASSADAAVGLSTSMTLPVGVSVGQTGLTGSVTAINTNTPPNGAESLMMSPIRLALSCGAAGTAGNPCPTPDPGVFVVSPTATGAAGTACAGITFNASAPDANGVVTLTPTAPVVLGPPGGAAGSDRCTVDFTFSVLKMPAIDLDPAAGVQTRANARIGATSMSGLTVESGPSIQLTVAGGTPTVSTQASPSVAVGGAISDSATVTRPGSGVTPTGNITFRLFGPDNASCAGAPIFTSTQPLSSGSAQSGSFSPTLPGTYRWVAAYSGDTNYNAVASACNAPNEGVVVTAGPRRAVADFDGDGRTDVAVFRPSTAIWHLARSTAGYTAVQFGTSTDIPVVGDYEGDGKADVAVFRPSTGDWHIALSSDGVVSGPFGMSGDIPVPADYDGDGRTDVAVFRPSTATWHLARSTAGYTPVVFGTVGDIPVVGDYEGDGRADVAVFRPSTGNWHISVSSGYTVSGQFGMNGDIPVPADYDGDGKTDVAIFRPSTATWHLARSTAGYTAVQFGVAGDIPIPGDYEGDGKADVAVFRPSTGNWHIAVSSDGTVSGPFGTSGDIPLPLPSAIRMFFF